jgi:predicted nuclease of predicted toxin-antitoxin system
VKILLDMNLSPTWVAFLVNQGFEAVHWSSVGDPRASDDELMAWAADHGHVLFTHDLDFGVLLALTHASSPSVIQVRVQDPAPYAIGHDVVRVLRLREDLLRLGALVTVDKTKDRVRVLPFAGRGGASD